MPNQIGRAQGIVGPEEARNLYATCSETEVDREWMERLIELDKAERASGM